MVCARTHRWLWLIGWCQVLVSKLHLVDLAGSERIKKTLSDAGVRLVERGEVFFLDRIAARVTTVTVCLHCRAQVLF